MGLQVAPKVTSLQNTLTPGFMPASFTAICKAAVPEERATEYLQPTFSQVIRSTSSMFAPTVDIQFVS